MQGTVARTEFSRVFLIENTAGPANPARYMGYWRAGAASANPGGVNLIRVPSARRRGAFDVAGKYVDAPDNPGIAITSRYTTDLSDLLRIVNKGCDVDLQVHIGQCGAPQDYQGGWEKIVVLEGARPTSYGTDDLGALDPSENNMINEDVPFEGENLYEIKKQVFTQMARAEILREVVDMTVCDSPSCGSCGIASDGCQTVFVLTKSGGGSPGLLATVLGTSNGGATWEASTITGLAIGNAPNAIRCVGNNVVVVSAAALALYYADSSDLLINTETWTAVTTGFNAAGGPRAIFSLSPAFTWIVGAGGYIYFTSDPTSGVSVLDSGGTTSQQLNAIHGIDQLHLVAVGNSNAVIYTDNGGTTWQSITGPSVGVNLNTVWMRSRTEWMVGTAAGRLYYTRDGGASWTEKGFPQSGEASSSIAAIQFATKSVGYMAQNRATPRGRILRTIDGGNSWYVAPEGGNALPLVDAINAIAVCGDANVVYAGGLNDDALDGVLLKGA